MSYFINTFPSLREAKRRSNPDFFCAAIFPGLPRTLQVLAMTFTSPVPSLHLPQPSPQRGREFALLTLEPASRNIPDLFRGPEWFGEKLAPKNWIPTFAGMTDGMQTAGTVWNLSQALILSFSKDVGDIASWFDRLTMRRNAPEFLFFPSPLPGEGAPTGRMRGVGIAEKLDPTPSPEQAGASPPSHTEGEGKTKQKSSFTSQSHFFEQTVQLPTTDNTAGA